MDDDDCSGGIDEGPITKQEIKNAIQDMKNSKADGIENNTVEMMKADIGTTVDALNDIFRLIREERILKIGQLLKNNDLTYCDNWRGIIDVDECCCQGNEKGNYYLENF